MVKGILNMEEQNDILQIFQINELSEQLNCLLDRRESNVFKLQRDSINLNEFEIINRFEYLLRNVFGVIQNPINNKFEIPWKYTNKITCDGLISECVSGGIVGVFTRDYNLDHILIEIKCRQCDNVVNVRLMILCKGLIFCYQCNKIHQQALLILESDLNNFKLNEVQRQQVLNKRIENIELFYQNVPMMTSDEIFERFCSLSRSISGAIEIGPIDSNCDIDDLNNYQYLDSWIYDDVLVQFDNVGETNFDIRDGISKAFKYNIEPAKIKIKIICNHCYCITSTTLLDHLMGLSWCQCYRTRQKGRVIPQELYIFQLEAIHKNKYDYRLFYYRNVRRKIFIICNQCRKLGRKYVFRPSLLNHKYNSSGCPICSIEESAKSRTLDWNDTILPIFKKLWGKLYEYSKFIYVNNRTKGIIICKRCRDAGRNYEFLQDSHDHKRGHGCPTCAIYDLSNINRLDWDNIVRPELENMFGKLYDYSKFVYIRADIKGIIICKRCRDAGRNYEFLQTIHRHKRGHGCSTCVDNGFKNNIPGILYILEIDTPEGFLYKVGITNRLVDDRYSNGDKCFYNYRVIFSEMFAIGSEAREHERMILAQFRKFKYNGPLDLFMSTKNTEVLTINPINKI